MPLVEPAQYRARLLLRNGHFQTIFPALFRRVPAPAYQRERIEIPDGDFIDIDWSRVGSRRLGIISHGLEGDTRRPYVLGMVRALNARGWDAAAWNARGCSGEPNRLLRFTHSGATEDLDAVVQSIVQRNAYDRIALIGFSLGGNLTLKYAGENGKNLNPRITHAIAFSVPCDLLSGSIQLGRRSNRIYMRNFLGCLRQKIRRKMELMPGKIDDHGYERMKTFRDFDDRYTAPLHGFRNAEDYWIRSSCKPLLKNIGIPSLLVNAWDDPFLAPPCFPVEEARTNPNLFLETPRHGGHNGFIALGNGGWYWTEQRALEFLPKTG